MKTLFFVSIHLYIHVDCMIYWTAHDKYDDQRQFLIRDLYNCFPNEDQHISLSILDLLKTMDICMKKTSYCLRTEDSNNGYVNKHHSERGKHIYCRLIAIDWKLPRFSSTLTHFTVHKGYLMHFEILLFDFEWSHFPCDANGLIIMKSSTTDELCFCGKRIPWIMIFKTRDLEMKIITILPYKLTIFYTIHNINWMYAFSQTVYFHLKDYYELSRFPSITYSDTEDYKYHIRVHPMSYIVFFILQNNAETEMAFYDGPGVLSKRVYEMKPNAFSTLGFLAFLRISHQQRYNSTLLITMESRNRQKTVATCFDKRNFNPPVRVVAKVTESQGQICFAIFRPAFTFLRLDIYSYVYKGPTSLDYLHNCQYGGLFFRSKDTTSICESRDNYVIYGELKNITMLVVWYKGYSYGHLVADLQMDDCITKYIHFTGHLDYHQIRMKDKSIRCQRVICPYINKGLDTNCQFNMKGFENKPIVVAILEVKKSLALQKCWHDISNNSLIYNISAQYVVNWPEGSKRLWNITRHETAIFNFDFLYEVNISMPFICGVLGVLLKASTCYRNNHQSRIIKNFVRNIMKLTSDCLRKPMFFTNVDRITHFIHTVPETERELGLQVGVYYVQEHCPSTCRKYRFALSVRYGKLIHHYTSELNFDLFTGYYHEGFRLTIIPPSISCTESCYMSVAFNVHKYQIGINKDKVIFHGTQEWHLHSKR